MTEQELTQLFECEAAIDKAVQGFVELGKALARIRNNKLFEPAYATFEIYLEQRWGYTRQYAWNLMKASDAYLVLSSNIDEKKLPKNERSMRALLKVPWDKRAEVLNEAAKGGEPTTERIVEAIATVIPKKATSAKSKPRKKPAIKPAAAVKAAEIWAQFVESCDPSKLDKDQRTKMTTAHNKVIKFFKKLTPAV